MFNSLHVMYWIGVVEDRNDPLFLGRVRVRVYGFHTEHFEILPTEDLPWAQVIQPVTSAAMSGVGTTPLGPVEGTTVIGFFADGESCQEPIVLGTLSGIPLRKPVEKYGFRDFSGTYPREEYLEEPDTNRLARRQNISDTVVQSKKDARDTGVPVALGGSWDQPKIPYNAEYPFNHVTESESGHIVEIDDTPGNERLHWYHRTGTFKEIDKNGTVVQRIVGDSFEIIERNGRVHIKGKCEVTVDGSANIYVKNNCNLEVDGNLKIHAHKNLELKAGETLDITAGSGINIHSPDTVNLNSGKTMNVKSLRGLNMTGTIKTTIASPITEVAVLKMNGMTISPIPPRPPIFGTPSVVGSKSPSEQTFASLQLPDTRPDVPPLELDPITEKDPIK